MKISGRLKKTSKEGIKAVLKAVFPTKCMACGALFQIHSDYDETDVKNQVFDQDGIFCDKSLFDLVMAPFLCNTCSLNGFIPIDSPMCPQCGMMFDSREGTDHLCEKCIRKKEKFGKARALGIYDKTFMAVIHSYKYSGRIQLAGPLSLLLLSVFLTHWKSDNIDIIVPIPLHLKRFRKRGFNQVYMLVKKWPKLMHEIDPDLKPIAIDHKVVIRDKKTQPQTGLKRKERMENIKNAFRVVEPQKVYKKRILLVDDVYTTGSTINECVETLLRAGAERVDVLTLARA